MTIYELLNTVLSPLVDGRAFADVVPMCVDVPNIRFILIGGSINHTFCSDRDVDAQIQIDITTLKSTERYALQQQVQDALDQLDALQDAAPVYMFDGDLKTFRCILTYTFF